MQTRNWFKLIEQLETAHKRLFWRTFQKAVADIRDDFCPDGLIKYWDDEAKTYNDDSSRYLRDIENKLKDFIGLRLEDAHGENWLIHGLPKPVYSKAKKDADEQNYDAIARGGSINAVTIWDCVSITDLKEIITYGKNWSELFESLLIRADDRKLQGGKIKNRVDYASKCIKKQIIKIIVQHFKRRI